MSITEVSTPSQRTKEEVRAFAEQHLGLVRKVAHEFRGHESLTFDDFVSIGTIGLMKAAERFDPSRSEKFSSVAVPYIRGEILHLFQDGKDNLIRHRRGEQRQRIASLDAKVREDSETTLIDLISSSRIDERDEIETNDERSQLRAWISLLSQPYQDSLLLTQFNGLTNREAAEWLGIHEMSISRYVQEGIRQIQELKENGTKFKQPQYKRKRDALPYYDEAKSLHVPPIRKQCIICDRVFGLWKQPNYEPKTCSSPCARKLSLVGQKGYHATKVWSDKELEFLKSLIGKMPVPKIVEVYQEHAITKQWKRRTKTAIEVKIKRIAVSVQCLEDGWTMRGLARLLDVPVDRVRVWCRRGLEVEKVPYGPQGKCVITRKQLHQYCQNQTWRFAGIDVEKLASVLDDRALAEQCASQPVKIKRIEVYHPGSKKIFRSTRDAARKLNCSHGFVRQETQRPEQALFQPLRIETIGKATGSPLKLSDRQDDLSVIDPSQPMTIRWLQHPDGRIFETNNLNLFAQIHGLRSALLSQVLLGRNPHHKGWRRPQCDLPVKPLRDRRDELSVMGRGRKGRIFRFRHPDGRIFETNNLVLFAQIHELDHINLAKLHRGKQQTHQGWARANDAIESV